VTETHTAEEKSAARRIVSYFVRNPLAVDSLEGIARWRLLEEQIHQTVLMTEKALRWLVEMELLVAEHSASAGTLYHLNELRRHEAEKFVTPLSAPTRSQPRRGKR
jgi:hypothetical protein